MSLIYTNIIGTAIETSITVTVRLTVLKNKLYVQTPHFLTAIGPINEEYYCTTGVDPGTLLRSSTCACTSQLTADDRSSRGHPRCGASDDHLPP